MALVRLVVTFLAAAFLAESAFALSCAPEKKQLAEATEIFSIVLMKGEVLPNRGAVRFEGKVVKIWRGALETAETIYAQHHQFLILGVEYVVVSRRNAHGEIRAGDCSIVFEFDSKNRRGIQDVLGAPVYESPLPEICRFVAGICVINGKLRDPR